MTSDQVFAEHRSLLFTIAYEITGSAADAEDVVQETYLRWREVDHDRVQNSRAYLAQTASRQALNSLRSAARRRETYVGPWLPEPILTTPDIAEDVVLADAVSTAMLVVLDTLGPDERAVFVLHEVFGFSHPEIAESIGKSPAAVRQIAHRAREHVQARRPQTPTRQLPPDPQTLAVLQRFSQAADNGDVQALMDVLAPDVVLLTDGGGLRKAALRPIHGSKKAAGFLVAVRQAHAEHDVRVETILVNGCLGSAVWINGALDSIITVALHGGRVTGIYLMRNPQKLAAVATPVTLDRGSAQGAGDSAGTADGDQRQGAENTEDR